MLAALAIVASVAIAVADRLRAWARHTLGEAVTVDRLRLVFAILPAAPRPSLPLVAAAYRRSDPRGPPATR